MNIINATSMVAGYTLGREPSGRESVIVAVRGTFKIPPNGDAAEIHEEQAPLIAADEFTGEPGRSAPLYESDYPPHKPRCDVLLNGSAYAPNGKPAQQVTVVMRVGSVTKSFNVIGDRVWRQGAVGFTPSEPKFFTVKRISYDVAFGGIDESNPEKPRYYSANHAGVGYHHSLSTSAVVDSPVPNTEEINNPVTDPRGKYQPMAFGPIGRSWTPRPSFAGTYDQNWIDNICPFLPADFKEDYYQSAPADQQMPYPRGGEEITLVNLTPEGRVSFVLPRMPVPIEFTDSSYEPVVKDGVIDTIILEPDEQRFMIIWRASYPIRRNVLEMRNVVVGKMPKGWYRAREKRVPYLTSLAGLESIRGEE